MTEKNLRTLKITMDYCIKHVCGYDCPYYNLDDCRDRIITQAYNYINGLEKAVHTLKAKLKEKEEARNA